jgi:hypothetical protein
MDRCAGFGYALWTIAQDLVVLWAIAPNHLPERRSTQQFKKKLAISFKGTVMIKIVCI